MIYVFFILVCVFLYHCVTSRDMFRCDLPSKLLVRSCEASGRWRCDSSLAATSLYLDVGLDVNFWLDIEGYVFQIVFPSICDKTERSNQGWCLKKEAHLLPHRWLTGRGPHPSRRRLVWSGWKRYELRVLWSLVFPISLGTHFQAIWQFYLHSLFVRKYKTSRSTLNQPQCGQSCRSQVGFSW